MKLINKIEEIAIYNFGVSGASIIYTSRKGADIEIFKYPSKDSSLLYEITGGLNYFKQKNVIYVNSLADSKFMKIAEGEVEINDGCLKQVNNGRYYLIEHHKEVSLLDTDLNKLASLVNLPKNYYQSIFYTDYMFVVSDGDKSKPNNSPRSKILKYNFKKDKIEEFFDAKEFTWSNKDGKQEKGFIRQLICEFNGSLLIEVSKYHIICLNIESGDILWEIPDFVSNIEHEKFLSYGVSSSSRTPMNWLIDEKNNRLLLLARHFCWSIDLLLQQVNLETSFLDSIPLDRWNIQRANLFENEILFTGAKGFQSSPNRIGIYDINERKIVWDYELESGYFRAAPETAGNYMAVSDSNGYLHVFAKDIQLA